MFVTISSGSKLISSSAAKNKTQSYILIQTLNINSAAQMTDTKKYHNYINLLLKDF